jgi:SAM-dependent methyltransferase
VVGGHDGSFRALAARRLGDTTNGAARRWQDAHQIVTGRAPPNSVHDRTRRRCTWAALYLTKVNLEYRAPGAEADRGYRARARQANREITMNEAHLRICSSPEWARYVAGELLPWVISSYQLGDDVLELGPGPGLTTDVLRRLVPRLTAVEIDKSLATRLARRLAGTNVTVLRGDGTQLPFEAGRFSAVALSRCCIMCHQPGSRTSSWRKRDGCCALPDWW